MNYDTLESTASPQGMLHPLALAKSLLGAGAHWGRARRFRHVHKSCVALTRQGMDIIDLVSTAKELALARESLANAVQSPGGLAIVGRSRAALSAMDRHANGLVSLGDGERLRIAAGRWRAGDMTNTQCGAWAIDRPAFVLAVGPGVEIALLEARALGIPCAWLADTDSDPRVCRALCVLNANSSEALGAAMDFLTRGPVVAA